MLDQLSPVGGQGLPILLEDFSRTNERTPNVLGELPRALAVGTLHLLVARVGAMLLRPELADLP